MDDEGAGKVKGLYSINISSRVKATMVAISSELDSPNEGLSRLLCDDHRSAVIKQQQQLIKSGKDPNLYPSKDDALGEYDLILHELNHLQVVMARMEAEYACVEAAGRAREGTRCMTSPGFVYGGPMRHNAAATIDWLQTNYRQQEGISLPRGAMFGHYLDYCRQVGLDPVNQASFGKVIRVVFPDVKTRRLGTRGQSKYHYYGLTIKDSSPYKDIMMSAQRVNNYFGEPTGKGMYSRTVAQTSLPHTPPGGSEVLHGSVLLQDFPSGSGVAFPDDMKDTVAVFLMMYRHHSQRVIDTILRANLSDVKEFVVHFWQSLPNHIHTVLCDERVVRTVVLADRVLYRAVLTLLIPGVLQPLPTNLMTAIRAFGKDLVTWLSDALKAHPAQLRQRKLQVARELSQRLYRHTAVSHMAAVARSFLHSRDVSTKLPADWATLDIDVIIKEVSRDLDLPSGARNDLKHYTDEFGRLLSQQMTLDRFVDWIKVVYSQTVRRRLESCIGAGLQAAARVVLLQWVYITKVFIRELTLLSAQMFGPYHLMSLLSQDYTLYLTEEWQRQEAEQNLKTALYGGERKDFVPDWDKLLSVSPYKDHSKDFFNFTSEKSFATPKHNFGYQDHSGSPILQGGHSSLVSKQNVNYASILDQQRPERCEFLSCHDDMKARFCDIERTPPDDIGPRALDLSLNYNSSFTDDDALVDKVISKGYATLDDCSQTISPLPWKSEASPVTSSPVVHHHKTPLMNSQSLSQASSTVTSAVTYQQLLPPQHGVSMSHRPVSTNMGMPINQSQNSNFNNNNVSQSTPSPVAGSYGLKPAYDLYSSSSGYLDISRHHHRQPEPQYEGSVRRTAERQPAPLSRSPHSFALPDFTHISGSLQVTPLNPRKKWIMEEQLRSSQASSQLNHMPST